MRTENEPNEWYTRGIHTDRQSLSRNDIIVKIHMVNGQNMKNTNYYQHEQQLGNKEIKCTEPLLCL